MHDEGDHSPNVPHFILCEVEDFHGSSYDCEILLVSHVSSVMLVNDVTGHSVTLTTGSKGERSTMQTCHYVWK